MLNKRTTPIIALLGAAALVMSTPALAQTAASSAASSAASAPAESGAPADSSVAASAAPADQSAEAAKGPQKLTIPVMFGNATLVVKIVILGLLACSVFSWVMLVTKLFEFAGLNRESDKFLESFRTARSVADINRIATSEEFEGNPMADMAAAAATEVELSRQAGLSVTGEHRDTTLTRASSAVVAVQASLAKRLSGGMQFLASVGSTGPFVGLFGTVFGIMNSFIGIANTNTTNLAVVAPGIAEALLATGVGLFAAIPAVVMYNFFQTRISAYGTRSEGFVAEVLNVISRQLDKGA
ncbi:MotA/TolQ/ExbB proton channel family protein [Phenylobacterium montanum]|uniref:MotA/TolQ/ExbB proton channel family protein n=1 Tax=Phenylobacterium montanum TaxID=2823693 RepID=A0A975IVV0_9CAUL|nr:MotA/TolQ/ExbB proton channel family protein [Caulobacter sp. S6]QUD89160.1 MotA/TolQ/ExbB proton channel family protein [Caulobacter sp. S6]